MTQKRVSKTKTAGSAPKVISELSKVFCIIAIIFSSTVVAADIKSYRNEQFHYGFAYPADWHYSTQTGVVMSVSKGVANINVTVQPVSPQNRGKYKSLYDEPSVVEYLIDNARNTFKADVLGAGKTVLSDNDAVWLKYVFIHKSLDKEVWIAGYQVTALRNDTIYTITTKVAGRSKREALSIFDKTWPIFKNSIVSLYIDPF